MALLGATTVASAPAASSNVNVSVDIATYTTLDASGCATGDAGSTDFGAVVPGTTMVAPDDCELGFEANVPARLRIMQTDGVGRALFAPADGTQDPDFDGDASMPGYPGNGRVTTALGTTRDRATRIVAQPDGRLLVGGVTDNAGDWDAFVARYHPDGRLDTSWGTGGVVESSYSGGTWDGVSDMYLHADGRLVTNSDDAGANLALHRFTSTGASDGSFGTGGNIQPVPCGGWGYSPAFTADATGRYVTAGSCTASVSTFDRYTSTGPDDNTFGVGGHVEFDACVGGDEDLRDVLVQPDGMIVGVGGCEVGGTDWDMHVIRIDADGDLDPAFGTGGIARIDFGTASDAAWSVAQQPDGKLVVGGATTTGRFLLTRLLTDGTLDGSFGTAGRVNVVVGGASSARLDQLRVLEDGRILVVGDVQAATRDLVLMRFTALGAPDTTFNGTGRLDVTFGTGEDVGRGVAIVDGGVIAAGHARIGAADVAALVRLGSEVVPQYGEPNATWSSPSAGFLAACVRSVGGDALTDGTTWARTGTCGSSDADPWEAIPTTAESLARATGATSGSTVSLRFGVAPGSTRAPGSYQAPVTFELVAG
jgi:uncharacterized delta-60 repeat protein